MLPDWSDLGLALMVLLLELSQQCENFFDITVLQFVGCLLSDEMELMATSSNRTYATHCASQILW